MVVAPTKNDAPQHPTPKIAENTRTDILNSVEVVKMTILSVSAEIDKNNVYAPYYKPYKMCVKYNSWNTINTVEQVINIFLIYKIEIIR